MTRRIDKQHSKGAPGGRRRQEQKMSRVATRVRTVGKIAKQHLITTAVISICLLGLAVWGIVALGTSPEVGTEVGNLAPDFTLENLDGDTVKLAGFRGKMVVANFWATWCDPCADDMPHLQAVFDDRSDEDLVILAINIGQSAARVRTFVANRGLTLPVLLDPDMITPEKYNLPQTLPATIFINTHGIIEKVKSGTFGGQRQIENMINAIEHHQPIEELPPIISDVSVSATESAITVSWATHEPATGRVDYRQLDGYQSGTQLEPEDSLVLNHSVTIGDLEPATAYGISVASHDAFGNSSDYDAGTFTTLATLPPGRPEPGMRAPDFTLQTVDGEWVTLSEFRGKIVMVHFWRSKCWACRREMPHIQAAFEEWPDDELVVLAISVRESADTVRDFAESHGLTFPVLLDSEGMVDELYQPPVFPTTFFVDAEGVIREVREERFGNSQEIESVIRSIITGE